MRSILIAAALAATVATPALARRAHADDAEAARIASTLDDPRLQDAMAGAMAAMAEALYDVRIDRLRAAIARIDPDADDARDFDGARTLGDMIERDEPYFHERLADDTRRATRTMGAAARGMAELLPEFRAMGERLSRRLDDAVRRAERRY